MDRTLLVTLLSITIFSVPVHAQHATPADVLARTAEDLADLWDGAFDTANQVNFQERFGLPEDGWVNRKHKIYARVDAPAFGPTVTYVEQYNGAPPGKLGRQRLYVHSVDEAAGQVVTDIYSFRGDDAAKVVGAHGDDALLVGFSPDNMDKLPAGCVIRWEHLGDVFVGQQTPEDCFYQPTGFANKVRIRDTVTLTSESMTTKTEILNADGSVLIANKLGVAEVARKAHTYTCWVLARNPAFDSGVERFDGITTHDQGGEFEVTTTQKPPKQLHVRLLKIVPPAGPSRDTLIMALTEQNNLFPPTMAFVEPNAPRVAVNTSGIEASCTADQSTD